MQTYAVGTCDGGIVDANRRRSRDDHDQPMTATARPGRPSLGTSRLHLDIQGRLPASDRLAADAMRLDGATAASVMRPTSPSQLTAAGTTWQISR